MNSFETDHTLAYLCMKGDEEFTIREVASWMGCSYMTAKRRLKLYGVKLRKAGKRRGGRGAPPTLYRRVK